MDDSSARENVEGLCCWEVRWRDHFRERVMVSEKVKHILWPSICIPRYLPRGMKASVHSKTCPQMSTHIHSIFVIALNQQQPRCSSSLVCYTMKPTWIHKLNDSQNLCQVKGPTEHFTQTPEVWTPQWQWRKRSKAFWRQRGSPGGMRKPLEWWKCL